jgi:hypothetical protein
MSHHQMQESEGLGEDILGRKLHILWSAVRIKSVE